MDISNFKKDLILQKGVSERISGEYCRILVKFYKEFPETNKENLKENMESFVMGYYTRNSASNTIRNVVVVLNYYLKFCGIEAQIKKPKKNYPLLEAHTPEEFYQMRSKIKSYRDLAIYLLMAKCGLRVGEVCKLNLEDFKYFFEGQSPERLSFSVGHFPNAISAINDFLCWYPDMLASFNNPSFSCWSGHLVLKNTKNKSDYIQQLPSDVVASIIYYLNFERPYVFTEQPLFLTKHTKSRLNRNYIRNLISDLGKSCNIKSYPHKLRHTCATILALENVPIPEIQATLRHKSLQSTLRYINFANQQKKRTYFTTFLI